MKSIEELSARYERAMEEMASAAEDLRRHVLAITGTPQPGAALTVLNVIARHFGVKCDDMLGSRRTSQLVVARQLAMTITRRLTGCTLQEVADQFGGRDHGTVLWAERNVMARCQTEPSYKRQFDELLTRCEAEIAKAKAP